MNIEDIRQLAEIMQQTGLTALEVMEKELRIRLKRDLAPQAQPSAAPQPPQGAPLPHADKGEAVDFNLLREVKSPMVGVFYPAPAPGSPPFVKKGDSVKKGQVLCIIEAMKMMNEITAEEDGRVVDICAQEGQLVEFSQVLFKLY